MPMENFAIRQRQIEFHKIYELCDEDKTIMVKDYAGGNVLHCIFLDPLKNVTGTTVGGWTSKMIEVPVPNGSRICHCQCYR